MRHLGSRIRSWFQRSPRDIDAELRFHLEQLTADNIRAGMTPDEARRQALIALGGVQQTREEYRDQFRVARFLEQFAQDVRYGLRQLRRSPGFMAVAVLSLALGIGANTALFSLVDAMLLKELPVHEPDRLVLLQSVAARDFGYGGYNGNTYNDPDSGSRIGTSFPYQTFTRLRTHESALSDLFAFASFGGNLVVDGHAETVRLSIVSGNYHAGLRVPPFLGRLLTEADDRPGASPVAVISHRFWQRRFGSDPGAIGKQINLNGLAMTVIGVTPPGFEGTGQVGSAPEVTVPVSLETQLNNERSRMTGAGSWWLRLMGRLKPGATAGQAHAQLEVAFQQSVIEHREARRAGARGVPPPPLELKDCPKLRVVSGSQGELDVRRMFSTQLYLLLGVVGVVLLIACANVANLLLARAAGRQREMAMRLAIGASRYRLMRQVLTESVLLAALGGLLGVVFALWIKSGLLAFGEWFGEQMPALNPTLDWRVLLFTTAVALASALLFGSAPAWRAVRVDASPALKGSGRVSGAVTRSWLSKGLVVAQVAMSLVLLIAAGLIVRTLQNLRALDPGFNGENLLLVAIEPGQLGSQPDAVLRWVGGYPHERLMRLYRELFTRFEAIPGVRGVTASSHAMLSGSISSRGIFLAGAKFATSRENQPVPSGGSRVLAVRENYFGVMEVPILLGRAFTPRDDERAPKVAVVNQVFAQRFFPYDSPVGKRFGLTANTASEIEIVGVARDTKYASLREKIEPNVYFPWAQQPDRIGELVAGVRAAVEPASLDSAVRAAVREVEPNLPVAGIRTQVQMAEQSLRIERLFTRLLVFFGVLALLLAAVGLYGVLAYSIEQRTQEVGIRRALGAQTADVLKLVVGQGMRLAMAGLVAGAGGALAATRLLQSLLYGVEPDDPLTFALVSVLLAAIALLACWLPARRAARVDPMVALRYE